MRTLLRPEIPTRCLRLSPSAPRLPPGLRSAIIEIVRQLLFRYRIVKEQNLGAQGLARSAREHPRAYAPGLASTGQKLPHPQMQRLSARLVFIDRARTRLQSRSPGAYAPRFASMETTGIEP